MYSERVELESEEPGPDALRSMYKQTAVDRIEREDISRAYVEAREIY